jgi:hypothetical protein
MDFFSVLLQYPWLLRLVRGLAAFLFSANAFFFPAAQQPARHALGSNDFLKTCGTNIRNQSGKGDKIYLRGTNAGGWLVQESWMCPTFASDFMDTPRHPNPALWRTKMRGATGGLSGLFLAGARL